MAAMTSPDLMQTLARFKLMARRKLGLSVDIHRLVAEPDYASEILGQTEECDDEPLVLLSLELADKLGLLAPPTPSTPAPARDPEPPAGKARRYVVGPRG